MKSLLVLVAGSALLLLSAAPERSCVSAGSMVGFVNNHVRQALEASDLNLSRYHAYKALNTIEKSKSQFEDCGCDHANQNIEESLQSLKLATRVSSLEGARILLQKALEHARSSKEAIDEHEQHESQYGSGKLALNTATASDARQKKPLTSSQIEAKIDLALENYRNSLEDVVRDVPCPEALEFVERIYAHCEKQLLREDLSPAKRYYNIRTKEITEDALEALGGCPE